VKVVCSQAIILIFSTIFASIEKVLFGSQARRYFNDFGCMLGKPLDKVSDNRLFIDRPPTSLARGHRHAAT